MMVAKHLAPDFVAGKLPQLLQLSLFDADLKRLLVEHPQRAAERFGLDEIDLQRLKEVSWPELEYLVGRLVRHKLMPMQIGKRVWITPKPVNGNGGSDRIEIFIDQSTTGAKIGVDGVSNSRGVVFGSGSHPTTRLSVVLLEKFLQPGWRVLDLGTGSGILSIAAVKLGSGEVVGLDIDAAAVESARSNIRSNGFESCVRMQVGGVDWLNVRNEKPFDLIVANILTTIHLQTIDQGLLRHLKPGGRVILSGMHQVGAQSVAQALYKAGAATVEYMRMGAWFALTAVIGEGA